MEPHPTVTHVQKYQRNLWASFQTIGTKPIAHIDHFTPEMLGTAELAEEVNLNGSGKLVKVGQTPRPGPTGRSEPCFESSCPLAPGRSRAAPAPGRR